MTAPYQADGREPTLQSQALGALLAHSQIANTPSPSVLDDVAAFQKVLFSSPGAKAVSDAIARGQTPPDPDPRLTPFERRGKALFEHDCVPCHGGPSQTQVQEPLASIPAIGDVFISKPIPSYAADLPFKEPPVPLTVRRWAVRVPGEAEPVIGESTDPGKALITGSIDNFNDFDVPTLFGISKTAPYFHDNSARTLTDVVRHYQLLFEAFRRVVPEDVPYPLRADPIDDADIAPLVAYLRKI
jgi:cytochrome c peroxidase